MLDDFWTAWMTLTRIPAPKVKNIRTGRSVIFFPFIGMIVSALVYLMNLALKSSLNSGIRSVLILLAYYFFFGFFHFDGVLDVLDGFLASHKSAEKRRSIMKDPHTGAFSLLFGVLLLLLQNAALTEFPEGWYLFPLFGRISIVFMLPISKPFSAEGLAASYYPYPKKYTLLSLMVTLPLFFFRPFYVFLFTGFCIAFTVAFLLRSISHRLVNGINGDILGSGCIFTEIAFLVGCAVIASFRSL
jgi:adenosylcobinamide-GDP ribazoletransferase